MPAPMPAPSSDKVKVVLTLTGSSEKHRGRVSEAAPIGREDAMPTTASIDTRIKGAPESRLCSSELTWDPWAYDASPSRVPLPVYGAGASQWDSTPATAPVQGEIPERYRTMSAAEIERCIAAAKAALGSRLVILGHHY